MAQQGVGLIEEFTKLSGESGEKQGDVARFVAAKVDSDTLMAARSQPNDNWGSVGNGTKHGEKHVGGGSGM